MNCDAISAELKIIAVIVIVGIAFALGMHTDSVIKDGEIATIQLAHANALGKAQAAKLDAEARVSALERSYGTNLGIATATFEEKRQHETESANRTIADLNARITRLRVSTDRHTAGGGAVPGTPAAAGGGDGQATETLSPAVAGRLAQRYADYNGLVDQLELCQATVNIDRQQ